MGVTEVATAPESSRDPAPQQSMVLVSRGPLPARGGESCGKGRRWGVSPQELWCGALPARMPACGMRGGITDGTAGAGRAVPWVGSSEPPERFPIRQ